MFSHPNPLETLEFPLRPEPGTVAAGVDVGGTTAKLVLCGDDGRLAAPAPVPTRGLAAADALDAVAAALKQGAEGRPVVRCGVGFPGIVRNGTTVHGSPNLPQWTGVDLAGELGARLASDSGPCAVRAANDANAAALAESRLGGKSAVRNLLFLTLGTGVGGGVVADGKILAGRGGFAGEAGHVTVDPDGEPCGCGRNGCLEAHFSELGLSAAAARAGLGELTAKEIFDRAKAGDAACLDLLDEGLDRLAIGISGMCALLDPEEIVLGGGIAKAGQFLLDALRPHLAERIKYPGYEIPKVRLAALGSDAGVLGALLVGLQGS